MRALIIALLLFLFLGIAGASEVVPTYQVGPDYGFFNPGTIVVPYLNVTSGATINGVALSSGSMAYDFTITANHNFLQSGSGTFGTGTGTFTHNGNVVFASNKGITVTSGTSAFDLSGGSGITKTTTGAVTVGPGAVGVTGDATFAKTITASKATTLDTNATITSADTKTIYEINASAADCALTLPDAATVTGRVYMIAAQKDPGSHYVRVKATAGKLGGDGGIAAATGLKNTDVACGITLVSDGTNYLIVGSYTAPSGAGWVSG